MARKTALLIGNDDYRDADLQRLIAPWDDVVGFKDVLEDVGDFECLPPLYNANLSTAQTAITRLFKTAGPEDLILLYYTGHGVRSENGSLFFALPDTEVDLLPANALPAAFIRDAMHHSDAAAQVVILDCCHSGAFTMDGAVRRGTPEPLRQADLVPGSGNTVEAEGKYVLTASEPNQSAYELGGESIFTRHLVTGLMDGAAAPEKDNITIQDLHAYLHRMIKVDGAPQRPMLIKTSAAPELVIARNPDPRQPLDSKVLELLWGSEPYGALGAAYQLMAIADDQQSRQADDAREELRRRLERTDNLPVLVADPIRARLDPAPEVTSKTELDQALHAAQSEITAAEQEHAAEARRHKKTRETSEARIAQLEAALEVEQSKAGKLKGLRNELEKLEKEREQEQEKAAALRTQVEMLEPELREVRSALEQSTHEVSNLTDARNHLLRRIRNWPRVTGVATLAAMCVAGYAYHLHSSNDSKDHELTLARDSNVLKDVKLDRADDEIDNLQRQLATVTSDPAQLDAEQILIAQKLMQKLGFYKGVLDGKAGPATLEAMHALLANIGRTSGDDLREDTLALVRVANLAARNEADAGNADRLRNAGLLTPVCAGCPEMARIPGGTFMMGSPVGEAGRDRDERPHEVTVPTFALAKTEVTFDQWQLCVDDEGCQSNTTPSDAGWGRGNRPVINVSWNQAQEYIDWLNTKHDGPDFRLPSEAEWEYAARAGTSTPFSFGETISTDQANYNGNYVYGSGAKGEYRGRSVPVSDLDAANAWGLRHMHGNVWEWVQDVYQSDYGQTPTDGSPHIPQSLPDDHSRVLRGGSWVGNPQDLRSADRSRVEPGNRNWFIGFRPARTLLTP